MPTEKRKPGRPTTEISLAQSCEGTRARPPAPNFPALRSGSGIAGVGAASVRAEVKRGLGLSATPELGILLDRWLRAIRGIDERIDELPDVSADSFGNRYYDLK